MMNESEKANLRYLLDQLRIIRDLFLSDSYSDMKRAVFQLGQIMTTIDLTIQQIELDEEYSKEDVK